MAMPNAPDPAAIKGLVEREVRRAGDALNKSALVMQFEGHGVSRATLYRWINTVPIKAKAQARQDVVRKINDAAKIKKGHQTRKIRKGAEEGKTASEVLAELAQNRLPVVVNVDRIAAEGGPASAIAMINRSVEAAEQVMAFARDEQGKPRASKLLLLASEHLRRCVETAAKIAEKVNEYAKVEQFQRAVIEEIRKESPDCARRILERVDMLSQQWGAV